MAKKTTKRKSKGALQDAPLVFMTTFSDRISAEAFARAVLSQKLVACVNLVDNLTSFYFWEGRHHRDKEILAIGKTTRTQFRKLKASIASLHPYKLPELIALPIVDGHPPYLAWIKKPF